MNESKRRGRSVGAAWEHGVAQRLATADFLYGLGPAASNEMFKLTELTADRLRKHEAYKARWADLEGRLLGDVEAALTEESKRLRLALAEMAPKALEVFRSQLSGKDKGIQFRAAIEVLDRDGRLPKVSKVQQNSVVKNALPDVDAGIMREFDPVEEKPN